jgi:hypothetical protein
LLLCHRDELPVLLDSVLQFLGLQLESVAADPKLVALLKEAQHKPKSAIGANSPAKTSLHSFGLSGAQLHQRTTMPTASQRIETIAPNRK